MGLIEMSAHRASSQAGRLFILIVVILGAVVLLAAAPAGAATITVNTNGDVTADDGSCTLREAITAANTDAESGATADECAAGSGPDEIEFTIAGVMPANHIIAPTTDLPTLTTTMSIDGSTDLQEIGLDGSLSTTTVDGGFIGLEVTGADVAINDLTVGRWSRAIRIYGADSSVVSNCRLGTTLAGAAGFGNTVVGFEVINGASDAAFSDGVIASSGQQGVRIQDDDTTGTTLTGNLIGTDPTGTLALPNTDGISVTETAGTRIGGPNPGDGNVISANSGRGILISAGITIGTFAEDATVQGNFIGTDSSGLLDLGNAGTGVDVTGDVRGTSIKDNVISGNGSIGIVLEDWSFGSNVGPSDTTIRGNRIGVDKDGNLPVPNDLQGISVKSNNDYPILGTEVGGTNGVTPGGPCTGDCNLIAGNTSTGVYMSGDDIKVPILGNEMRDNGSLGIDLTGFAGATLNDPGDVDTGANELQNFPVFGAALADPVGGRTLVTGRLNSTASATFRVEVFENTTADPSGYGEGEIFLGAFDLTTDISGDAFFGQLLPAQSAAAAPLSATATRTDVPDAYTSEFSLIQPEGCDQSDVGGADLLTASGTGDALCGLAGDDVLRGAGDGDIFDGGEGSDTADFSLASSPDSVDADLVSGRAVSNSGIDVMVSIENLTGSPFADTLTGDAAANRIDGGAEADTINPGAGSDTVLGGDGNDVIDIADGVADASVDCGPGADTVTADSVDIDADTIYTGCETINRPDPPDPVDPVDPVDPIEPPDPVIYKCDGKVATIVGTNQAETLVGTSSRDIIVARAGADTIKGKEGNDIVCAGDGNDTVKGGDGIDLVYGQGGADELFGEDGKDDLFGGDGKDDLFGGDGADVLNGGTSADLLDGRAGADTLKGKAGGDTLKGGDRNDTLRGGDSADTLRGGDGKDTLKGEKGNDTLKGENGTDKMFGGDGKDKLFGGSGGKDKGFGQGGFDKLDGGGGAGDVCNGGSGKDRKSAPRCEKKSRIP